MVHMMRNRCSLLSMKVSMNLDTHIRKRPSDIENLTPILSMMYPEIVSPYTNRNIAEMQKSTPDSYYVIPNSYWQKTRNVRSSIRNIRETKSLLMKMIQSSHVCFS